MGKSVLCFAVLALLALASAEVAQDQGIFKSVQRGIMKVKKFCTCQRTGSLGMPTYRARVCSG
jgi:hypothetical protein